MKKEIEVYIHCRSFCFKMKTKIKLMENGSPFFEETHTSKKLYIINTECESLCSNMWYTLELMKETFVRWVYIWIGVDYYLCIKQQNHLQIYVIYKPLPIFVHHSSKIWAIWQVIFGILWKYTHKHTYTF